MYVYSVFFTKFHRSQIMWNHNRVSRELSENVVRQQIREFEPSTPRCSYLPATHSRHHFSPFGFMLMHFHFQYIYILLYIYIYVRYMWVPAAYLLWGLWGGWVLGFRFSVLGASHCSIRYSMKSLWWRWRRNKRHSSSDVAIALYWTGGFWIMDTLGE